MRSRTAAVNWFFAGHRNKLTVDASRLTLEVPGGADLGEDRVRVQWAVTANDENGGGYFGEFWSCAAPWSA